MKPVLFDFDSGNDLVRSLVHEVGCVPGKVERHQFPDGESYIRLMTPVEQQDVILLAPLCDPDAKTLSLLFAADAARRQGARSVGLVAPYLAYMRQDKAFRRGEAVTSVTFARLLSAAFDWLVTVDPHLHRHGSLEDIYTVPSVATSAVKPIAAWIREHVERPFLIGPDIESAQWVERIAKLAGAPFAIFTKSRKGDFEVEIDDNRSDIPPGATPVIVDDIASSARTMIEAVGMLQHRGHSAPVCIVVHALFAGGAFQQLIDAGPASIVSTNTVPHASNGIDVGSTVAEAVLKALKMIAGRPS